MMRNGITSPSANRASALRTPSPTPDFVILGNPGSRRIELFQAALKQLARPPAQVVSYVDIIAGRDSLHRSDNTIVRIELPGKDFEVERALLVLGAECDDPEGEYARLPKSAVEALTFEKGRILPARQWYLGYCTLLNSARTSVGRRATYEQAG